MARNQGALGARSPSLSPGLRLRLWLLARAMSVASWPLHLINLRSLLPIGMSFLALIATGAESIRPHLALVSYLGTHLNEGNEGVCKALLAQRC